MQVDFEGGDQLIKSAVFIDIPQRKACRQNFLYRLNLVHFQYKIDATEATWTADPFLGCGNVDNDQIVQRLLAAAIFRL